MFYDTCDSPVGKLTIATDGLAITQLHIEGDRYFTVIPNNWVRDSKQSLLRTAKQQLEEYFAGERAQFDIPLKPAGTKFQLKVWHELQRIPPGTTSSYGRLAAQIGQPNAARAVGTAIGRNPICILIPCHRIVTSAGHLGGFVAGVQCKQRLLTVEKISQNS